FTLLSFIITLSAVNAQKGIDFNKTYPGGGRLIMNVDSLAKNVYYSNIFPNQPNTSFSYLPEVNNVSIQIYFRQTDSVQHYRYTRLDDHKPLVVTSPIKREQVQDVVRKDYERQDEIRPTSTPGTFPIKDKIITTLV